MYVFVTYSYPYFPTYHPSRWYASDEIVYVDAGFDFGYTA
jgi:hypothetical protein